MQTTQSQAKFTLSWKNTFSNHCHNITCVLAATKCRLIFYTVMSNFIETFIKSFHSVTSHARLVILLKHFKGKQV